MNLPLLCSALLVVLYAGLSLNVSVTRRRKRRSPTVTDVDLLKAIRAHGNASEYIPIFVALLVFLGAGPPSIFLSIIAVLATLSRGMHAAGMLLAASIETRHPLKAFGAIGTYVCLFSLAVALLLRAW